MACEPLLQARVGGNMPCPESTRVHGSLVTDCKDAHIFDGRVCIRAGIACNYG